MRLGCWGRLTGLTTGGAKAMLRGRHIIRNSRFCRRLFSGFVVSVDVDIAILAWWRGCSGNVVQVSVGGLNKLDEIDSH